MEKQVNTKTIVYSIIIPHKEIPNLLQRCLNSIPQRDDLEVIVVDDNSNPDFVDFKNFPGQDRSDVKVIFTNEGKGAGYARNVGLQHVSGKWVLFADADDYYNTGELQRMLDIDYSEYDVVAWSCMRITKAKNFEFNYFNTSKVNTDSLFRMPEPWRKMVRLSLIEKNNIRFQETAIANDLMFSIRVAAASQHFYWYPHVVYNWEERICSLSSKYSGHKLKVALNVSIRANQYLKGIGKLEYYDRTPYYLFHAWMESPVLYWYYWFKVQICLGTKFASLCNIDVAKRVCGVPNIQKLIIISVKVYLKRLFK